MAFTSWEFGIFAAAVLAIYYFPAFRPFQVQVLVAASIFFYGYGQPQLLALLVFTVVGTYAFLLLALGRRAWMWAGIAFNIGLLAFFKYKFLFFAPPIASGNGAIDFLLNLPLPIGISFFVFHNISLLVDLTKLGQERPSVSSVFLYIIFFPQLVSGPITRAQMFLPQIEPKHPKDIDLLEATRWIVLGYFFKLYVANNLNEMTSYMNFPLYETLQTQDKWLLVFLYSYQIYADFYGYSAIAIGLGLLFGYRLPINFDRPYTSISFSEFWTRWHISLSTWLRTYLYIPLGGNRHGTFRTYLNLMIVMTLGGLWHGAGLSYALWGCLHGLLLVIERSLLEFLTHRNSMIMRTIRMCVVFLCVTMLWIFFKLPHFDHALSYLKGMFTAKANPNPTKLFYDLALLYSLPVLIQHVRFSSTASLKMRKWEPYLYGVLIALSYLEAGSDTAFIYFQF
jgi:alginate O-acetyltransferase complex protein AlgI